jgi:hypothetical protein
MSGFLSPAKLVRFPFSPILYRGEGARRADEGRSISNIGRETAPHPTLSPLEKRGEEYLQPTRSVENGSLSSWGRGELS